MEEIDDLQDSLCHNILTNSPFGIIYFNLSGTILFCNNILIDYLALPRKKIVGNQLTTLFTNKLAKLIESTLAGENVQLEVEYQQKLLNKMLTLKINSTPVHNKEQRITGGLLYIDDLTPYKLLQEEMEYHHNYDPLTKLPNRKLFVEQFNTELKKAEKARRKVALFFIDIDRFKTINDIMGFEIGDQVLKKVAQRLATLTNANFGLTRIGGDSFAILETNITSLEEIKHLASKVLHLFKEPICIEQQKLQLTTSVGISIFPVDGEHESLLMKNADLALSQAKKAGRNNYKFYTESVGINSIERLNVERNLRKAIINNQFKLYYQPQIKFSTGEIIGIEALARWNHKGEIIPPSRFIPIAEETGLIHSIGEWVLKEACQQNKLWQEEGLLTVPIAVNISIAQIQQQNFVDMVAQILEVTGLEGKYLELELTESMFIQNMDTMMAILKSLKNLGINIVLDDFGTGYSSLSYLQNLYIDSLKIDRSFVQNIPVHTNDGLISTAIINLAKSLKIQVVAEGVETEEQVQFLVNNNCDQMQGYLFSRPLCAEQLKDYLLKKSV